MKEFGRRKDPCCFLTVKRITFSGYSQKRFFAVDPIVAFEFVTRLCFFHNLSWWLPLNSSSIFPIQSIILYFSSDWFFLRRIVDSDRGVNWETNRHTFDEQSTVVNEMYTRCASFPLGYLLTQEDIWNDARYRCCCRWDKSKTPYREDICII